MKASQYLLPTTKDDPQDAVVASHKLMIRSGLVRKSHSGLYSYLPMGLRILKKIESIIRQEMNHAGALEFELPILTPSEFWQTSGRWDKMGKEMFRLKDRHDNESCLGPTHEESFCNLMKPMLKSYKDLPINVYQMHTKFRDEIRPRYGVIRSREFTMKDAYSFHLNDESLDETYQLMRRTYRSIFGRMGLATIPVQADSGNMGGSDSEEFMVVSPIGEETLMICPSCGYNGNIEKTALVLKPDSLAAKPSSDGTRVETPNAKSIQDVASLLSVDPSHTIKAVAMMGDGQGVLVFLPGDRELNEAKLKNASGFNELHAMGQKDLEKYNLIAGYIGPHTSFHTGLKVYLDSSISANQEYVVGANEFEYHKKGFTFGDSLLSKDSQYESFDLVLARKGDACPNCGTGLSEEKGIEVGHIFKLGQKYTKAFEMKVLDKNGKTQDPTMGCYGIGVNRCMATIIEQCNDDKGIFWPISVAPFEVCIVNITKKEEDTAKVEGIYQSLKQAGIDVFWDDRDLGPGFKFKDSELIGFPIRLTLGKDFVEKNEINILIRKSGQEIKHTFTKFENLKKQIADITQELYSDLGASNV
jgi:prolyl-tRNA synthetase